VQVPLFSQGLEAQGLGAVWASKEEEEKKTIVSLQRKKELEEEKSSYQSDK